jgi:hypothetical protein
VSVIDVFPIGGQSNAVGNGGIDFSHNLQVDPVNVLQWDGSIIKPATDPVNATGQRSAWPAFGQTYYNRSGRPILLVPAAVGSSAQLAAADTGAGNWDLPGTLLPKLLTTLEAALSALRDAGWTPLVRGALWVQGETDADMINGGAPGVTMQNYKTAFYNMIGRFQQAYPASFFYVFRLGRQNAQDSIGWQQIRQAQEDFCSAFHDGGLNNGPYNLRMVFRGAAGFYAKIGLLQADQTHYTARGLNLMGFYGANAVLDNGIISNRIVVEADYLNGVSRSWYDTD